MTTAEIPVKPRIILSAILEELKRHRPVGDDAWSADEIADYMKLSKGTVQSKILSDKTFPTAKVLPTGGRRWREKEVRAWFERR